MKQEINKKVGIAIVIILILAVVALSITLPIVLSKKGQMSTQYDVVKQSKMDNFTKMNALAIKNKTVFIGDSLIEIFPTQELFNEDIVYNRGISGDTSDKLLERIDSNAINIFPKNLVVLIGTNDLGRGIENSVIADNIKSICDRVRTKSPQTKVIICSVLPVRASVNPNMVGRRKNSKINELNASFKVVAEGNNATFAPVADLLLASDLQLDKKYTYDGLHLNYEGFSVLANAIKQYLD